MRRGGEDTSEPHRHAGEQPEGGRRLGDHLDDRGSARKAEALAADVDREGRGEETRGHEVGDALGGEALRIGGLARSEALARRPDLREPRVVDLHLASGARGEPTRAAVSTAPRGHGQSRERNGTIPSDGLLGRVDVGSARTA
jgi:hypothetical protein